MIKVHTKHSEYILDVDDPEHMRYMRLEGELKHGDDISHRLKYAEWHPMNSYTFVQVGTTQRLHLMREDSTLGIFTSPVMAIEHDVEALA